MTLDFQYETHHFTAFCKIAIKIPSCRSNPKAFYRDGGKTKGLKFYCSFCKEDIPNLAKTPETSFG